MKINEPSLETRYMKLAINFSCDMCGMTFMATGKDFRMHIYDYIKPNGITVICPKCNNDILAESAIIELEGAKMVEYILSLPPIYCDE